MRKTMPQLETLGYQGKAPVEWMGYILLGHWPKGSHNIPQKHHRLFPKLSVALHNLGVKGLWLMMTFLSSNKRFWWEGLHWEMLGLSRGESVRGGSTIGMQEELSWAILERDLWVLQDPHRDSGTKMALLRCLKGGKRIGHFYSSTVCR